MAIDRPPATDGAVTRVAGPLRTAAGGDRPERPTLQTFNYAPVVAQVPPPFAVRLAQLFWVLSIAVGSFAVVYAFIVRTEQVDLLTERVRGIAGERPEETLTAAADIVFWCLFATLVFVVLLQIVSGVSFSGRRKGARWWMLAALMVLALALGFGFELSEEGTEAAPLPLVVALQGALGVLALLFAIIPAAIRWTARRVDIRRGPVGDVSQV